MPQATDEELRQFAWDFCKHVTTLSTAAIGVLVGFREKWQVSDATIGLIPIALVMFVITFFGAPYTMSDFFQSTQRGHGMISFRASTSYICHGGLCSPVVRDA
jgi:hypothetical protein